MLKHKKLLGAVIIGCVGLGYLIYFLLGSSIAYYSTVSELKAKGEAVVDRQVRVGGTVVSDSVDFSAKELILKFTIADESASLPVVYQGVVPDAFKPDIQVVVEGRLDLMGVVRANSLLTKCPSKYQPEQ
ncbi:MAG: hypothetical protein A2Y59_04065 [Chloroflexi bacterium RBG_13_52_14]|nr:MAG: hypothetical protein A2Y59_04065 [Chloroflexi bacterium RBG_13_52_14]